MSQRIAASLLHRISIPKFALKVVQYSEHDVSPKASRRGEHPLHDLNDEDGLMQVYMCVDVGQRGFISAFDVTHCAFTLLRTVHQPACSCKEFSISLSNSYDSMAVVL